ncbi:hypothetical protein M513_11460 [Trichuris suis]|uniref:Uncharacterized protein n=1 Tax=Trichuris suis TaxID=68888 RepID=A0A085LRS3_9BILA|nr:hypothetical protein M513_11460 [Trichuris suis]
MESRKKTTQDSTSGLPEGATKCVQLLSPSSDIVAQDVNDCSTICSCTCMKVYYLSTGCSFTIPDDFSWVSEFSC